MRLSGEVPLLGILMFAYSLPDATYCEAPSWMFTEWYQIEAIAPAGTTTDSARAMLQTALAERLGLQYHLVDKERRILVLLRGIGDLKLEPSTEDEPNPGLHRVGVFQNKSASLADFAGFLSAIAGVPVIDKTGIMGRYKFDVDWSGQVEEAWNPNPSLAIAGVKRFGLKLEAGKEMHKRMVIDRANKEPTPN